MSLTTTQLEGNIGKKIRFLTLKEEHGRVKTENRVLGRKFGPREEKGR
jgi:hypothetical protein